MKEQEVTRTQQVFAVELEPRVADAPPVFISPEEPTSTIVSGQVDQQQRSSCYCRSP